MYEGLENLSKVCDLRSLRSSNSLRISWSVFCVKNSRSVYVVDKTLGELNKVAVLGIPEGSGKGPGGKSDLLCSVVVIKIQLRNYL